MVRKIYFLVIVLFYYNIVCAQVGIGTSSPDNSSVLDMVSDSKGFSLPNINLTSVDDGTTIKNPKKNLLVYNTGETIQEGVYYNGGDATTPFWIRIKDSYDSKLGFAKLPLTPVSETGSNKSLKLGGIEIYYEHRNNDDRRNIMIKSTDRSLNTSTEFRILITKVRPGGRIDNNFQGNRGCTITSSYRGLCNNTNLDNYGANVFASYWLQIKKNTYFIRLNVIDNKYFSLTLEQL